MEVIILGATGSVGRQCADVIRTHPERLHALGLAAHHDIDRMEALAGLLHPSWIVMDDPEAALRLKSRVSGTVVVESGPEALLARLRQASRGTAVVAAMSGFSGLGPTLAAAHAGLRVCLANKETLVAAGPLVTKAVQQAGGRLIPIDSEHSALMQSLGEPARPFRRLILTCSGGPFRGFSPKDLATVTVARALEHPTWKMGAKITIDSATLMNKGLELLEAHWLFNAPLDQMDVVIHPQSVVHSLVEFIDGSTLAQLGTPDMRVPIQVALSWPDRWALPIPPLDLPKLGHLDFEKPDLETFPSLALARMAGEIGGTAPTALNAANEVAVSRFLAGELPFTDIFRLVEAILAKHQPLPLTELEVVLEADRAAREQARLWMGGKR